MFSDVTLAYAEELTTALLGVDALYRAERDGDSDGLVVFNMSTTHQPEPFGSYAAVQARFAELGRRADGLPEHDRRLYYRQVCGSTQNVALFA